MRHASLFSGIGGPEVAAAMMGWDNAFHCEINPFGRAVLEYWFPNSKSYEDITKTDFTEWRGKVDVLTGGFPCQPFSYAGKRGGRDDERYLWPEMLRVIDEVRPAWVVGENVAGITTMVEGGVLTNLGGDSSLFPEGDDVHRFELDQSFTIERICRDLERLGYSVQPVLIPAAGVGAPHRRDRVFILAHASDADRRDDVRVAGEHEGEGEGEGLSERHSIWEFGEPDKLRSEVQGAASNAESDGGSGIPREQGSEDAGSHSELYAEFVLNGGLSEGTIADPDLSGLQKEGAELQAAGDRRGGEEIVADPDSGRQSASASEDRFNGEKSVERGRSFTFPGTVRPRTSRSSADPYGQGREESQQPGRGEDSEEDGTGMDDRTERSGGYGESSDTFRKRLERENESGSEEGGERVRLRGDFAGHDWTYLRPENRWQDFPTVSPVHRGNDGIPFSLGDLALPATRWRTEALKAYGNAIVPQVMYRIFQAIEKADNNERIF